MLDLDACLRPLSDDAPCGEDLEYDAEFGALERATEGTPEQEIGSTIVPAQDPEWAEVVAKSLALTERSKDLRVCVYLTEGLLNMEGTAGLAQGLALVRGTLESFWDCVHPQLDPEDDNDPTMRVNILGGLCHPNYVLGPFRRMPLIVSPAIGRFSLRDIALASGVLAPERDEPAPDPSAVEAAWKSADPDALADCNEDLRRAMDELNGIDTALNEKLPAGTGPDFTPLRDLLREAKRFFDQRLMPAGEAVEESPAPTSGESADRAASAPAPQAASSGEIRGRDDVIKALDKICEYYARNEPSSPIPLLMRRARRLVNMDFMALIQNLAPDGLTQVESIRGPEAEDASDD